MSVCNNCGEAIEFRYIDGMCKPIHINGGYCNSNNDLSSQHKKSRLPQTFYQHEYFVNPHAICPLCHERVFYYENSAGSKVYFDELRPPWPKHKCMDYEDFDESQVKKLVNEKRAKNRKSSWKHDRWRPFLVSEIKEIKNRNEYYEISGVHKGKNRVIYFKKEYPILGDTLISVREFDDISFEISYIHINKDIAYNIYGYTYFDMKDMYLNQKKRKETKTTKIKTS